MKGRWNLPAMRKGADRRFRRVSFPRSLDPPFHFTEVLGYQFEALESRSWDWLVLPGKFQQSPDTLYVLRGQVQVKQHDQVENYRLRNVLRRPGLVHILVPHPDPRSKPSTNRGERGSEPSCRNTAD